MANFIKSGFTTTDTTAPRVLETLAKDTFSRTTGLGSTEIGNFPWAQSGTWAISSGALVSGDTTVVAALDCTIKPGRTDLYKVSAKVSTFGAGGQAGLVFRRGDGTGSAAGYVFYARTANNDHILARHTASNGFEVIAATTVVATVAGETVSVEISGSRIICRVNGTVTHDVTDSTYTGGNVGLYARNATAANPATFDDFLLTTA
ncbi:hypothetical protein [Arthrobacter woluwensis]|uniref:hypothetical protein n=1 Tax=Arthrobacter woluwensis TaxID=156980 RepID=UPI0011B27412|nr:hypothetical protein [Arthrobacter woluwensis]